MTTKSHTLSPAARILFEEAQAAIRAGDAERAAELLTRSLAQAPQFTTARQVYATLLLYTLGDPAGAIRQIDMLLDVDAENAAYLGFRAAALARIGDYDGAFVDYEMALVLSPHSAPLWLRYGHALKTAGRTGDAVAAYRKSLNLKPGGEAWWSLADLKTVSFTPADIAAMRTLAQKPDLPPAERAPLHFALGRALEEQGDYAASFAQFDLGNALKRSRASATTRTR